MSFKPQQANQGSGCQSLGEVGIGKLPTVDNSGVHNQPVKLLILTNCKHPDGFITPNAITCHQSARS